MQKIFVKILVLTLEPYFTNHNAHLFLVVDYLSQTGFSNLTHSSDDAQVRPNRLGNRLEQPREDCRKRNLISNDDRFHSNF